MKLIHDFPGWKAGKAIFGGLRKPAKVKQEVVEQTDRAVRLAGRWPERTLYAALIAGTAGVAYTYSDDKAEFFRKARELGVTAQAVAARMAHHFIGEPERPAPKGGFKPPPEPSA